MITSSKLLEHLEPVFFTFVFLAALILSHDAYIYFVKPVIDLSHYSPFPYLDERLEPYATPLFQRIEQAGRHLEPYISPVIHRVRQVEIRVESYMNPLVQQAERSIANWLEKLQGRMSPATNLISIRGHVDNVAPHFNTPIKPLTAFEKPCNPQEDSPLLSLPTEILDLIVQHALTPHPDISKPYPFSTCYRRPGHFSPSKTSTTLLQTCQAIYSTHWYLPWTLSSHTFYLTANDRCPPTTTSVESMMRTSYLIEHLHPDAPNRRKQVSHIQVFAQLWALEGDYGLGRIFRIPHFNPKAVTITIRHTDWWFWEDDEPLHFERTSFVANLRFPASVEVLYLEFESLERKKAQVEWMANHVTNNWHFTRVDDVHLVAGNDNTMTKAKPEKWEVTQWKGSATWGGQRWIRDEDEREPNVLSYYVAAIPFRVVRLADDPEGYKQRYAKEKSPDPYLMVDASIGEALRIRGDNNALSTHELEKAGILGEEDEETGERPELEIVSAGVALWRARAMQREQEYETYETGDLFSQQVGDSGSVESASGAQ